MLGLFDSGSGGLTVLAAIRRRAPDADIAYFGDIENAPYGERSADELVLLTKGGMNILRKMGADEIVSACNSVSLSVLEGAAGDARVIEMTRPLAHAMRTHAGKRMLLIATPATIAAGIYRSALGVSVQLDELPIPELAGAIEFGAAEEKISSILSRAFSIKKGNVYDGVILGCTHYPLVREIIESVATDVFGPLLIIDPADAVAEEVERQFDTKGSGATTFRISKDSEMFRKRVAELFRGSRYTIDVV